MRCSIVFLATILGSAAATQFGELGHRDVGYVSERSLSENAGSGLQERKLNIAGITPKGYGKGRAPPIRIARNVEERDLDEVEERDFSETAGSDLQARKIAFTGRMRPKNYGKGHAPRPARFARNIEERDIEDFEERDLYEDGSSDLQERALIPRRFNPDFKSFLPNIKRPRTRNNSKFKRFAGPSRRQRDIKGLKERYLYEDGKSSLQERARMPKRLGTVTKGITPDIMRARIKALKFSNPRA